MPKLLLISTRYYQVHILLLNSSPLNVNFSVFFTIHMLLKFGSTQYLLSQILFIISIYIFIDWYDYYNNVYNC